jgi:hypothetical protein
MRKFTYVVLTVATGLLSLSPSVVGAQKRSRDVIKNEEILASVPKEQDLFSTIQRLRPHFLENRGRTMGMATINPIRVYVDRSEQAGIEFLRSTIAWDVDEVRFLSASDAAARYGDRANGGAIVLKMVKVKKAAPDTLSRF